MKDNSKVRGAVGTMALAETQVAGWGGVLLVAAAGYGANSALFTPVQGVAIP